MNQIAICIGSIVIYWSAIVIFCAVAACFSLAYGLYAANGGKKSAMWAMLPVAVVLGVLFSRMIHWYCHAEQYAGFISAITDYTAGDYVLPGAFIGVAVAVLLVRALRLTDSAALMFDCIAPAAALGVGILRLSALFNNSCRGKIQILDPDLQCLPLGSAVQMANGAVEYRFATFFIEFIVMMVLFLIVMRLFNKRRNWPMQGETPVRGNVALLFLAYYGATQVILDSTRYDSSFLPINGFVSLVMILGAVSLAAVMVYYTVMSVRVNGFAAKHAVLWVLFLGAAGGAGYMEYLVQRYGNMYLPVYAGMTALLLMMCMLVKTMYRSVCLSEDEKDRLELQASMNPGLKEEAEEAEAVAEAAAEAQPEPAV